jgi:phage repressor protein C with HTH and peptisase S24 domain
MRKLLGLTQAELAVKVEVKAQAVSSWERERSIPKGKQLQALSKVFSKDEAWILYGDESSKYIESAKGHNKFISLVPLFENIYVSAGCGFINPLDHGSDVFYPIPFDIWNKQENKKQIFCLTVHGESMSPILLDKAIIAVNSSKIDIVDGRIYVIRCNDRLRVKLVRETYDGIILTSFNPAYSPEAITWESFRDSECSIVGEVFWYSSEINK